ncbi:hypothetical protein TNCV_4135061 [Trichonephila clavipes]|nr:hypothetical protein TNCV_4135061 [Trichonephila clavipes]
MFKITTFRRNAVPNPRVRNSVCSFCNIFGVTDLHAMLIRLSKSNLLVDSRSYTLLFRKPQRKKSRGLRLGDHGATLVDLRSRLFECQMSVPKM